MSRAFRRSSWRWTDDLIPRRCAIYVEFWAASLQLQFTLYNAAYLGSTVPSILIFSTRSAYMGRLTTFVIQSFIWIISVSFTNKELNDLFCCPRSFGWFEPRFPKIIYSDGIIIFVKGISSSLTIRASHFHIVFDKLKHGHMIKPLKLDWIKCCNVKKN